MELPEGVNGASAVEYLHFVIATKSRRFWEQEERFHKLHSEATEAERQDDNIWQIVRDRNAIVEPLIGILWEHAIPRAQAKGIDSAPLARLTRILSLDRDFDRGDVDAGLDTLDSLVSAEQAARRADNGQAASADDSQADAATNAVAFRAIDLLLREAELMEAGNPPDDPPANTSQYAATGAKTVGDRSPRMTRLLTCKEVVRAMGEQSGNASQSVARWVAAGRLHSPIGSGKSKSYYLDDFPESNRQSIAPRSITENTVS